MTPIDAAAAREFLEAVVAGFSVLGGVMAYLSGFSAAQAMAQNQSSEALAHAINEGIGKGFNWGSRSAVVALIIMVWT